MSYTNGLDKPTDYFNTKLYTGNGSTNAITGVGFQPDWVWCKARSYSDSNFVFDAVRGATKHLQTNSTSVEVTNTNSLTAFGSDGFTLGSDGGANSNTDTYASWNWKAGGTASSNTDGSITSTVSANTTSGFSIVSYTGNGTADQSIGHGLGAVPKMIILKQRSGTEHWAVYHAGTTADKQLYLNLTNAEETTQFDAPPSSSLFYVDTNVMVNDNSQTYIAYCFAQKKGFSKFGSYTGNGNADGTFVYTGFKPAMVICKKSSASGTNWGIIDNKRANSFNEISAMLNPNSSGTEGANNNCDFVSNGFKWRSSDGNSNTSGDTFIYMAFASEPFTTSTGIPCTAR